MDIDAGSIPRPSFFRDMESSHTLEAAMPGTNVVRKGVDGDTPIEFFRHQTYATLSNAIADDHETLLETFRDICDSYGLRTRISCPVSDCDKFYERKKGEYPCGCDRRETMFETDALRLHEYFANDVRGEGEALGRLRSVLEILTLFNILRFFVQKSPAYLKSCAFVLDGPLALFGTPASILRPIRAELLRLNAAARRHNGADIALFGIEKTGRFREHLTNLDWRDKEGPGSRFPEQTAIALNDEYIKSNIVPEGKPFGEDTHFGRVVLYKTLQGEHAVVNTAMLNEASQDADANSLECYPRLNDILDVVDALATHIYKGGFMPLARAHARAAIPLKRGTDIIKALLED